ncbi:MAG TPA: glycosyltransferase family 4 protein [Myxococcaceae bacterium]|nr:glycosyltransferase family 4 protein [Myxococcaceae bacterium]
MTRILHLRSSCGLYGAERALLELAGATRGPYDAIIGSIVRPQREDVLGPEARRRGLPTLRMESLGRIDWSSARALAQTAALEGVGLLHAHDYKSLSLAALIAPRLRIPAIATFHGETGATVALSLYEGVARVLGNLTNGVAAVSEPLARKLRKWTRAAPVHFIPNGIPAGEPCTADERRAARQHLAIPADAPVLAVIGRLSPEKGHAVLFQALKTISSRATVLVAGDGPLETALRVEAQGLDVRWLGFVEMTRPAYAAADVVVMPSLTEGLPITALEAMALGRTLVASSVGELPRMLAGGAGRLVPPGDVAALADALQGVLASAEEREAMVTRARERVRQEYSIERTAERYARLLYAPALARGCARQVVEIGAS